MERLRIWTQATENNSPLRLRIDIPLIIMSKTTSKSQSQPNGKRKLMASNGEDTPVSRETPTPPMFCKECNQPLPIEYFNSKFSEIDDSLVENIGGSLKKPRSGSFSRLANQSNPLTSSPPQEILTDEERLERMKGACEVILNCIGEDPEREGLLKTPKR